LPLSSTSNAAVVARHTFHPALQLCTCSPVSDASATRSAASRTATQRPTHERAPHDALSPCLQPATSAPTSRDPQHPLTLSQTTLFHVALSRSSLPVPIDIDTSVPFSRGGSPTQLMPTATTPPRPRLPTWR
jgi:hypothetical protein